ncbi:MAG: hypothetical protein KJP04_07015 [Arenicella sp.]|nr:hypothetical protein [Arenicella sp.]
MRYGWGILLICALLAGCAGAPKQVTRGSELATWIEDAGRYHQSLLPNHPDRLDQILFISDEMRKVINREFGGFRKRQSIDRLATWLIDPDGHGMTYQLGANLTPVESYKEQRGNCISFTILLYTLARELDVELRFNEVDLPDEWGMGDDENHLVLYRHVNAVYRIGTRTNIYDLALENYDRRYPQRAISEQKAVAMLHNNRAIDAFKLDDLEQAFHYLRLAVNLAPDYSDLYANLGVFFKRKGQFQLAEQAFLYSLQLDKYSTIAASSLERFYRESGQVRKAERFAKRARFARQQNPYYQYGLAKKEFAEQSYSAARKSVKRAKRLHAGDDRFFELSARIEQQLGNYRQALRELEKAHQLSNELEDRNRYFAMAEEVAQLLQDEEQRRTERRQSDINIEIIRPSSGVWR